MHTYMYLYMYTNIHIVIQQITLNRSTVYSSQTSYLSCYHNQQTSLSN